MAQTPEQDKPDDTQRRWSDDPLLWPFAGLRLALDAYAAWLGVDAGSPSGRVAAELGWTTPQSVALQLSTMCLRDFSTQGREQAVLVCAPFAMHGALIADFAPEHSIVEALRHQGLDRVYVTDWCSAQPDMRYLCIDDYLADLNVAVDEIGPPVDLVGLCQGGWLALIFAARFPKKVRRLVLAGSPVDTSIPSRITQAVSALPAAAFESLVDAKTGIVDGRKLVDNWAGEVQAQDVLQRDLTAENDGCRNLLQRFEAWNDATMNLPGTYYLEVVNSIFRENRIATGHFVALGRTIHPSDIRVPVFLLAGTTDEIVPMAQAFATAPLLGTPPELIARGSEPCGHLGLFMGRKTMANAWRRIAHWLAATGDSERNFPPSRGRPAHDTPAA